MSAFELKDIATAVKNELAATTVFDDLKKGEVKPTRHIDTIRQDLEGQTYPGTNVEYTKRSFKLNGERVEGVFPVFKSEFTAYLPKKLWNASDNVQFKHCIRQLSARIEIDPSFAEKFTTRQIEQIKAGSPRIDGLIWHHSEIPGRMQLVDSKLHETCRHTGGRSLWGGGGDYR